ncbi:MAG: hypothetical protein KW793_03350, partial [Candidatus Doudnabacteria bacterium]|nr:hypothetical protein [Candidatus Doudnabacteria bacterium]
MTSKSAPRLVGRGLFILGLWFLLSLFNPQDAKADNSWTAICTGSPSNCPAGANYPLFRATIYSMPYASSRGSLIYYGGYISP